MQLRVVGDQPWDVSADVLVVPIVGEPRFDGALAELDKRAGGGLSGLAAFGELKSERYDTVVAAAGELPAGRLLAVCVGEAETITRQVIVRIGSTVERRLAGRTVGRLAFWIGDLGAHVEGGAAAVAELLARGVVEGEFEPATIYRDDYDCVPPALEELILIAPGADAAALRRAAERGVIIGEGTNTARRVGEGHVLCGGGRQRQPAADDRVALRRRGGEGRGWSAAGSHWQGCLL